MTENIARAQSFNLQSALVPFQVLDEFFRVLRKEGWAADATTNGGRVARGLTRAPTHDTASTTTPTILSGGEAVGTTILSGGEAVDTTILSGGEAVGTTVRPEVEVAVEQEQMALLKEARRANKRTAKQQLLAEQQKSGQCMVLTDMKRLVVRELTGVEGKDRRWRQHKCHSVNPGGDEVIVYSV
jgi:hypothetical protein